jgi:hypothetical protein
MHGMLRRAAASAVPALVGLVVSPASAMAAPHTGQALTGPGMSGREVHERLVRLPLPGTDQGRPAGTTSTAETTADTYLSDGTEPEFATTTAIPVIMTFPTFIAIPVYSDGGTAQLARFSRVPGSVKNVGAPAYGLINYGKGDKITGNHIAVTAGSGNTIYRNVTGSETGSTGSTGAVGSNTRNISGP